MRYRMACGAFALVVLAGCGGAPDCSLVATPAGSFPKACVIEVPSGSTVSNTEGATTVYAADGGLIAVYPPCPCARH